MGTFSFEREWILGSNVKKIKLYRRRSRRGEELCFGRCIKKCADKAEDNTTGRGLLTQFGRYVLTGDDGGLVSGYGGGQKTCVMIEDI